MFYLNVRPSVDLVLLRPNMMMPHCWFFILAFFRLVWTQFSAAQWERALGWRSCLPDMPSLDKEPEAASNQRPTFPKEGWRQGYAAGEAGDTIHLPGLPHVPARLAREGPIMLICLGAASRPIVSCIPSKGRFRDEAFL